MHRNTNSSPGQCGSVGWSIILKKGCRFDSWSGHMPGLQVCSPFKVDTRGSHRCFSHIDVFLSLSLPLSPKYNNNNNTDLIGLSKAWTRVFYF